MSRAELARDLDAVSRHLVLLAALTENLAHSLRTPQEGPDLEDDAPVVPAVASASPGKGDAAATRRARTPGDLPAPPKEQPDRTGLPACTRPPSLAERARGDRP